MIKRDITYTDLNGNTATEPFWFHLSKAEVTMLELSADGNSLTGMIEELQTTKDGKKVTQILKDIITMSVGYRSADGRRFVKTPEYTLEFTTSEAFSELYVSFFQDAYDAGEFFKGLISGASDVPGQADNQQKSPSQTARERSEAQLQGHQQKKQAGPDVINVDPAKEVESSSKMSPSEYEEFLEFKRMRESQNNS